jgi:hypothetical protein
MTPIPDTTTLDITAPPPDVLARLAPLGPALDAKIPASSPGGSPTTTRCGVSSR